MYTKIMVPIDLAHLEKLDKAMTTAIDLARHYKLPICYVGVTAETPTEVAHTPAEFERKMWAYAAEQAKVHGLDITAAAYASHDPRVEMGDMLVKAAHEVGADLIIMPSHVPEAPDHLFGSKSGMVATHADVSVFLVR